MHDLLILENQNTPSQSDDLGHVRRDQNNRLTLIGGQVPNQPVDLRFGPDIDTDGRLVDDQDIAPSGQPLANTDLLLVATALLLHYLP